MLVWFGPRVIKTTHHQVEFYFSPPVPCIPLTLNFLSIPVRKSYDDIVITYIYDYPIKEKL